jgi:hypothetical protein
MDKIKIGLYLTGFMLIGFGYNILGVSPETELEKVVVTVRLGMFMVWGGALLTAIALVRRS